MEELRTLLVRSFDVSSLPFLVPFHLGQEVQLTSDIVTKGLCDSRFAGFNGREVKPGRQSEKIESPNYARTISRPDHDDPVPILVCAVQIMYPQ